LLKTSWAIVSEITKHELKSLSVCVDNPALFTLQCQQHKYRQRQELHS